MRNPTIFRAQFSGLILTVFGKKQTMQWKPTIEMFQLRDSPELWGCTLPGSPGRLKWEAASPAALACVIEEAFVERLKDWTPLISSGPRRARPRPENVIWIDSKRQA